MNAKQRRILERLFDDPPGELPWDDVESLLRAVGAELSEGAGSRPAGADLPALRRRADDLAAQLERRGLPVTVPLEGIILSDPRPGELIALT